VLASVLLACCQLLHRRSNSTLRTFTQKFKHSLTADLIDGCTPPHLISPQLIRSLHEHTRTKPSGASSIPPPHQSLPSHQPTTQSQPTPPFIKEQRSHTPPFVCENSSNPARAGGTASCHCFCYSTPSQFFTAGERQTNDRVDSAQHQHRVYTTLSNQQLNSIYNIIV
jgi:hypothetical protein